MDVADIGPIEDSECEDEGEELVSIAADMWDPCMGAWVSRAYGGRRLDGQTIARYMGPRSQELLYEVQYIDGNVDHLAREQVLKGVEHYQAHAKSDV